MRPGSRLLSLNIYFTNRAQVGTANTSASSTANPISLPEAHSAYPGQLELMQEDEEIDQWGGNLEEGQEDFEEEVVDTALEKLLVDIAIRHKGKKVDLHKYLSHLSAKLNESLPKELAEHRAFKCWLIVDVIYDNGKPDFPLRGEPTHICSGAQLLMSEWEVPKAVEEMIEKILNFNHNFIQRGSGLVIQQVDGARLQIAEFTPLSLRHNSKHRKQPGGKYIPLPPFLMKKRAILNIKNKDNRCMAYAVLSFLHPCQQTASANRPSKYLDFFSLHGLDRVLYPVEPRRVQEIEELIQCRINLFTFFDDAGQDRAPLYISRKDFISEIDLLYWTVKEQNGEELAHYARITHFSRFMGDITKHNGRKFWCKRCLQHFGFQQRLEIHLKNCKGTDFAKQFFYLPDEGNKVHFFNIRNELRLPFVVYADSEAFVLPTGKTKGDKGHASFVYQKQTPCSVGYHVASTFPEMQQEYRYYVGDDCVNWFMHQLLELQERCMAFLKEDKRMIISQEQIAQHDAATLCHICGRPFDNQQMKLSKVKDHDHFTGLYRGAAHSQCNIQLQKKYKIPVFFHNFRGYDGHFIAQALGKYPGCQITVIGQGIEKYLVLNFSKHIVFKDSLQFLSRSLDSLGQCLLASGRANFKSFNAAFQGDYPGIAEEKLALLLRKGIYPYEYMDGPSRFEERCLPPIEAFHSTLHGTDCTPADYEHAQQVWREFDCQTLRDYHDLYLKQDVLILEDVFENFRDICLKPNNYGLDPAQYVSSPNLSWDAMLKQTKIELELISDPAMFRMIDSGMRGGVAVISQRYACANNPLLGSGRYNPNEETSWISYLDANNLYGWAMSQPLPQSDFKWVEDVEGFEQEYFCNAGDAIAEFSKKLPDDGPVGYFLEVDLEYPVEQHDLHKDYPLLPERLQIDHQWLSEAQHIIQRQYDRNRAAKTTKLVPNLLDKKFYVLHHSTLNFALVHGIKLKKIHRIIAFKQSTWLASYIALNSDRRREAKNDFEKEFYKLMNNAVYGKTCENLKKRSDVRLLNDRKAAAKLIAKPHCKQCRKFNENLIGIEMKKVRARIDKPFYVGFAVLELSKLHMFR